MSGDQLVSSFGDPSTQPPTPKQTPTSSVFPSSVFETPKKNQGRFDDSGGWTPVFAEEYSVFNATPGNLRGTQGPFHDFVPPSPYTPASATQKRPLSAEGLAAQIAAHENHFSPNPSLLPPVEPSRQLGSSPNPLKTPASRDSAALRTEPSSPITERSTKKARRGTVTQEGQGQTATPPPTARKGERKIAPKLDTGEMQNDNGFGQPDFMGTPQHPGMGNFVTTPNDMFNYPMSAPATAPAFSSQRPFWDDPNMAAMDIDFSANGTDVFQMPDQSQRNMGSVEWRSNQVFQDPAVMNEQHMQQNAQNGDMNRSFVSQAPLEALVTSSMDQSMFSTSYPTPVDDPFGISTPTGGVNPGLLFSRPQSSSVGAASSFSTSIQMQNTAVPASQGTHSNHQPVPARSELRRTASAKDISPSKQNRASASSPIKPTGRPGLTRSFSENRGKKLAGRTSLPPLAPAPRPQSQLASNAGVNANRTVISQPPRPSGRSSPLKSHHQRLSSLSSIPEMVGPRTRTEAKFTIDANGRARVETTIVVEDEAPRTMRKRHSSQAATAAAQHLKWTSILTDDDEDSSSTDDEPIIIPSRNTSFALPEPRKPSIAHALHSSHRSISERSSTSHSSFLPGSLDDYDSDTDTPGNDVPPTGKPSGDAASELRKLREKRPRPLVTSKSRPSTAGFASSHYQGRHNNNNNTTSPTTLTDTSLPTPSSSDSRGQRIRCVCNRPEVDRGNDFLVQCESCEMRVHGRCVNITERTMPSIYICAFCANTPNARGGRVRNNGRMSGGVMGPPASSVTSPLAHKSSSFRHFR